MVAWCMLLSEIAFEQAAFLPFEPAYGFFLDLADALSSEAKFVANLFQCHFLTAYTEKHFDYLTFSFG